MHCILSLFFARQTPAQDVQDQAFSSEQGPLRAVGNISVDEQVSYYVVSAFLS